ncbi:hypothetical protein ACP70R_001159 [Stipagrostis hirtigluma subsp. patula]
MRERTHRAAVRDSVKAVLMSSFCYALSHGHGRPSCFQSSDKLRSGMPPARQLLRATKASISFKGVLGSAKIAAPQVKKKLRLFSCSCIYPPFLAPQRPRPLQDRIREQLSWAPSRRRPRTTRHGSPWFRRLGAPMRHASLSAWNGSCRTSTATARRGSAPLWDWGSRTPSRPRWRAFLRSGSGASATSTSEKGLRFIERNLSCITDDKCDMPVGFNIIFPGMPELGVGMGMEFPLSQADVNAMLRLRDMELKRCVDNPASGSKASMAYVAEGLGKSQDWAQVMTYQRKNGSFFNSPSTTAAAAIHTYDHRALDYLDLLISKFGSSVPTVYPLNIYSQLCMVDTLEKMGISHSFACEINYILDMAYRSWLQNDDEIMLDMATCAMAFRLLRMHGYGISSVVLEEEFILESIGSWSGKLLKQQLCSNKISQLVNPAEVEHALKFPFYSTLDRLEHNRNIESFRTVERFHTLKSAYCACHANEEIASLAAHEFSFAQSVYQEELRHIECWVKESRLDELKFARLMPAHALFTAAATMFPSQLSDARIAWAKKCLLVTVVDDFFDYEGSREETVNLVALIDKWDAHGEIGFCSERVEIMFRAVYNTSNELGAKAAVLQNRSVTHHIAELWQDAVRTTMVEAEWRCERYMPSMEEYMRVAEVSFLLGPIVPPSAYFVGTELPEEVIRRPEYGELFRHVNTFGRLLNDMRTYEKERRHGKLNSVMLHALRYGDSSTGAIEVAKQHLSRAMEASRKELLRLVHRAERRAPGVQGTVLEHVQGDAAVLQGERRVLLAGGHDELDECGASRATASASLTSGHPVPMPPRDPGCE